MYLLTDREQLTNFQYAEVMSYTQPNDSPLEIQRVANITIMNGELFKAVAAANQLKKKDFRNRIKCHIPSEDVQIGWMH